MADTPKERRPAQPRGFVVEIGTPQDVEAAGELGAFAGYKTKGELEQLFAEWLGTRTVAGFLVYLKGKAHARLEGLGPKATGLPEHPSDLAAMAAAKKE